ncbi:hypothetical protein [Nocardia sp. R7R-8]|uniref:hypothetical protein n=1 Tax=Nocardia sp. R7R-8 TaxID=3459304 RepID=UPI00403DEE7C
MDMEVAGTVYLENPDIEFSDIVLREDVWTADSPSSVRPRSECLFPAVTVLQCAIRSSDVDTTWPKLARLAHELGRLFCSRHTLEPTELSSRIDAVIGEIDDWAVYALPNRGREMALESLGLVIAKLAKADVLALQELGDWSPPADRTEATQARTAPARLQRLWRRLAQQVQAYEAMVKNVLSGAWELPGYVPDIDGLHVRY